MNSNSVKNTETSKLDPCAFDKFSDKCYFLIKVAVRILSALMTFVILWGTLDVVWVLYRRMSKNQFYMLEIEDMLATFGAFLAVLIAIEIYENIIVYLDKRQIQIRLVLATALMAAARKVIVFDYKELSPDYIWATAGVIIALGGTYWLITFRTGSKGAPTVD